MNKLEQATELVETLRHDTMHNLIVRMLADGEIEKIV